MYFALPGLSAAQFTPLSDAIAKKEAPHIASFESAVLAYESGDYSRALSLAQSHAAIGLAEAQVMVGHILLRGEAGLIDTDKALKWFRLAADQKDTDAYMAIGEMALRSQGGLSPASALKWFSAASIAGRADAKRAIGEMYIKGTGVDPDIGLGQDWLQKAVDMGDDIAIRKLADSYFEQDAIRALSLYERAAGNGDTEAAYISAIMYAENLNIRPNSKKLANLLKQAADAGHAAAQADYGLLVYQGAGTARSATEAAKWFEKSAKGGDSEGQFLYAFTLAKGDGVEKSFEEAYFWLLKSSNIGVDEYDNDRKVLRERLEKHVDPATLKKAKDRLAQ